MLAFFLLVFALSVPFWVIGGITGAELVPGLPVGALMAVCPIIAAAILTYRKRGGQAVRALVWRAFDWRKIRPVWYLPILLIKPGVMVLSYWVMRAMGRPLPAPRFSLVAVPVMLAAFFVAAVCEEVGWSGYAIDRLQRRWSALGASVLLGVVWAAWHTVPVLQAHRSASWIAWHGLETVASRVLMVWLYNATGGSVLATVLYHDVDNVSWLMFPNVGSHYDPRISGPITALVAAIVAIAWGPRTLGRRGDG